MSIIVLNRIARLWQPTDTRPVFINTDHLVMWQPDLPGSLVWVNGIHNTSEGTGGAEPIRVLESAETISLLTGWQVFRRTVEDEVRQEKRAAEDPAAV